MKTYIYFCLLLLLLSCSKTNSLPEKSLVKSIENAVNSEAGPGNYQLFYNEHQLSAIERMDDFSINKWEATREQGVVTSISISVEKINQGITKTKTYSVNYEHNQISLVSEHPADSRYLISHTHQMIDTFRTFPGGTEDVFHEGVFQRNADGAIDAIHYFTDFESNRVQVYQFTFSGHTSDFQLEDTFNPVYYFSLSFYEPYIASLLGLKISEIPPYQSSFLDENGDYREEFVTAQVTGFSNEQINELTYSISDRPSNTYFRRFIYE